MLRLLPLLAALLVAGTACDPKPEGTQGSHDASDGVLDALGRTVLLEAPPRRIVSLAPSNTEIVFALGLGDRLVGRDSLSDFPAAAAKVPSIGAMYPDPNFESIAVKKPDLILAAGTTRRATVQALAGLGYTVYAASNATRLDDVFRDIATIGKLVGADDQAAKLLSSMKTRVDNVRSAVRDASPPRVFYEMDAGDPAKPWTAGPGSFVDELVGIAGGTNIGRAGRKQYFQLSLEVLLIQDPEVIILGSTKYGGVTPAGVEKRVGWNAMQALKDDRVHAFDDDLVSRPGPRVVDGVETLAKLLHPDRFR
ncbi:MAG: ABC transporter substrate-binding protein [Planctomycetota bacterium]